MNYLKSILLLILLLFWYYIVGYFISNKIHVRKNRFAFKIVSGYICFNLVGFIVGIVCRILNVSWNAYFYALTAFNLILLALFIFIQKTKLLEDFQYFKENILRTLFNHIKKYWFVYVLATVFLVGSVINMQPYIKNNYGDDAYIVKILHLYKSQHLFDIDTLGIWNNTIASEASQVGMRYRYVNTYEMLYSAVGSFLGIDLPFFCRFTVTFNNYLIIFFVIQLFAGIFVSETFSQYCLIPFLLLLFPQGYISKSDFFLKIRMFENWRFQTGVYLGGSINRILSFPLYIYAFYLFRLNKNNRFHIIKFIASILCLFIFFLSYHTAAISYFLLIIPLLLIGWLFSYLLKDINVKNVVLTGVCFGIILAIILLLDKILNPNLFNNIMKKISSLSQSYDVYNIQKAALNYTKYYKDAFTYDIFAKSFIIPLIGILLLSNKEYKRSVILVVAILYLLFAFNTAKYLLSVISFTFYGTARLLTSLQLIGVALWGILIMMVINKVLKATNIYEKHNMINSIFAVFVSVMIVFSLYTRQNDFKKYVKDGDGFVKEGYSFKTLTDNDKMIPQVFNDVGQKLDQRNKSYYTVVSESNINYKGSQYTWNHVLLSSYKCIRLDVKKSGVSAGLTPNNKLAYLQFSFDQYSIGKMPFEKFNEFYQQYGTNYVLTTRNNIKNDLIKHSFKVAINDDGLWVLEK